MPFVIAYSLEILVDIIFGGGQNTLREIIFGFLSGGYGQGSYYYPIMMQFIFVFPVIYFIVRKHQFKGVIICGIVNAVYELLQCAYGMNEECYRLLIFRYILLIAAGCFASDGGFDGKKRVALLSCICGLAFIIAYCYCGYVPQVIIYWTRTSFIASLYIIPITVFLIRKCTIRCRILELFGKASYNIFLVQMVFYKYGAGVIYELIDNRMMQLLANIVICLGVGGVFYYVETPITKYVIKCLKKIQ